MKEGETSLTLPEMTRINDRLSLIAMKLRRRSARAQLDFEKGVQMISFRNQFILLAAGLALLGCHNGEPPPGGAAMMKRPPAEVGVVTLEQRAGHAHHRVAGPDLALPDRRRAPAGERRAAKAAVRRGRRRAGRPAALPDRSRALPGRATTAPRPAGPCQGGNGLGQGAGGPLQGARRHQRGQQAGLRQRGRRRSCRPQADVASGQAAVETAHINLVYTKVLSPITGRTGRSVTEGALVTANQTTPLVTVQQLDPIYVDIPQSTALLLRLRRELAGGQIKSSGDRPGAGHADAGGRQHLRSAGRSCNSPKPRSIQSTGSVILRAVFPNPQKLLLPGMFVTAHLEEGVSENGILVPQQGVTHNPKGEPTALVVTPGQQGRAARDQDRPRHRRQVAGHRRPAARATASSSRACRRCSPAPRCMPTEVDRRRRRPRNNRNGTAADLMSNFFIDRPIFAWVIAIILMLAGVARHQDAAHRAISAASRRRPWRSPSIYPGASAETVQSTVVQVIEQQLSGIDHLLYFSSESDKDGSMTITLNFEQGTNPDIAQVQVQNKLQLATPLLPPEVQQQGLRVAKATKNFLLVVGFSSHRRQHDRLRHRRLHRLDGAGPDQPHARRGRLPAFRLAIRDAHLAGPGQAEQLLADAGRRQQRHRGAERPDRLGRTGRAALGQGAGTQRHRDRALAPADAGGVRRDPAAGESRRLAGAPARRGAGRARRGKLFASTAKYNGHPASGLAVKLASGANALETADAVHATMDKLKPLFPPGLQRRSIPTTPRRSSRSPSRKWSRRSSSPSSWSSSSCISSCKICARR